MAQAADGAAVAVTSPDAERFCALGALVRAEINLRLGPEPFPGHRQAILDLGPILEAVVRAIGDLDPEEAGHHQCAHVRLSWWNDRRASAEAVARAFERAAVLVTPDLMPHGTARIERLD